MGAFGTFTAHGTVGKICRVAFYSTNILSQVVCLTAAGYGIAVVTSRTSYAAVVESKLYLNSAMILIVIGLVALCNLIFAFYSAVKELRCFLYTYCIASAIIFIMLLMGGVMGFVFRYQLVHKTSLRLKLLSSLRELYAMDGQEDVTKAWDDLQINLHCCAVNGTRNSFRIWRTSKWYRRQKGQRWMVPDSCCRKEDEQFTNLDGCRRLSLDNPDEAAVYTKTCYKPLERDLLHVAYICGCLGILTSVISLLPAVFAGAYARLIQK